MKKVTLILLMGLVTVAAALFLDSCTKDTVAPSSLKLVSVKTDLGVALDGATAATGIPVNASVIATFDRAINISTATSSSIAIVLNGATVAGTVTASYNNIVEYKYDAIFGRLNYDWKGKYFIRYSFLLLAIAFCR